MAQIARDPTTYKNAGISEDYIFAETMQMFKITFWDFFNLMDSNLKIAYGN